MSTEAHQKITTSHLKRNAYLYVRQSTVRQVFENTESTKRQYALRQRAVTLGWPEDRVVVIDTDLGLSGASAGSCAVACRSAWSTMARGVSSWIPTSRWNRACGCSSRPSTGLVLRAPS